MSHAIMNAQVKKWLTGNNKTAAPSLTDAMSRLTAREFTALHQSIIGAYEANFTIIMHQLNKVMK